MQDEYQAVVGLEVHVELCTDEKLFCHCSNRFGEKANSLCCQVCLGKPGALPVLNRQAVEFAVRLGMALGCQINNPSYFDRKHYEYPDLPRGYQITQQRVPLCQNGVLRFEAEGEECAVEIERIHLEEDTGKTVLAPNGQPMVDFNRSGVPLVEVVTRPVLHSAPQAKAFLQELAATLRALKVWDGKMQEGSLRTDVNVSLRPKANAMPGPRCELKNLNGFGAVGRAICHEAERQAAILAGGQPVRPETRRWDDKARESTPLRPKSGESEYDYQPEPCLPPLLLDEKWIDDLRKQLPELPWQQRRRLETQYGLPANLAQLIVKNENMCEYFIRASECNKCKAKTLAEWMTGDVLRSADGLGLSWDKTALTPQMLAEMLGMVESGEISGAAGKRLLPEMMRSGENPRVLAEKQGLLQISDENELQLFLKRAVQAYPGAVEDWRGGKKGAKEYLLGQAMAQSGGRANPALLRKLLEKYLTGLAQETVL